MEGHTRGRCWLVAGSQKLELCPGAGLFESSLYTLDVRTLALDVHYSCA